MQIVVVEDNRRFAGDVMNALKEFFQREEEAVCIRRLDGSGLLEELERGPCCDLCLLDVEMPGMDGITLGEKVRALGRDIRIVYLTAHEKYAYPSYRIRADGYVLKENYRKELPPVLIRILREEQAKQGDSYMIRSDREGCRIQISDLLYLEKKNKYTCFYCREEKEYRERETLENILGKLPGDRFAMIDKGVAVNLEHVLKYVDRTLIMRDGMKLQVSRRTWTAVKRKLDVYWG